MSQTSTEYPSDPTQGAVWEEVRADSSRPTLVALDSGKAPADELSRDLHDIALANRILASRVCELDAELHRQVASVEQLHRQVAVEMQRVVAAESLVKLRRDLKRERSRRRRRVLSLPRRAVRRLRRTVRSR